MVLASWPELVTTAYRYSNSGYNQMNESIENADVVMMTGLMVCALIR